MSTRTVLISGAGVAGATLAYWLDREGFDVTVVERSEGQRSSGNPVDVKGPAIAVADRMGILPRLLEARSPVTRMSFVNASGKQVARADLGAFRRDGEIEVEIPRAELASILLTAAGRGVHFLWNDTITGLVEDEDGVDVTFERSSAQRFDVVIGADGLHSRVRRLVFGDEARFVRQRGMYVATLRIEEPFGSEDEVTLFNVPGRAVSVHPTRGHAIAAFLFRHGPLPGRWHRDTMLQRQVLAHEFADTGWHVPDLLARMRTSEDLYFDAVSQVRMPRWSRGRVALVGDAASCLSLFGDGTTLAMAGAATLARELGRWSGGPERSPQSAFDRYEREHRAVVAPKLNGYRSGASMIVPATRTGIVARNALLRTLPALRIASAPRRSRAAA